MSRPVVRGTVLHCSRFGAVVRLDDGRICLMPSDHEGMADVRRAASGGRRPSFAFVVESGRGRRARVVLAEDEAGDDGGAARVRSTEESTASSSFEQKIIDFLRQTSERDGGLSEALEVREERARADRMLRFEYRERRKPGDEARRPKR